MSVERMRLLLDLDHISDTISPESRQQISPQMKFTCNGMITKWIVGAEFSSIFDENLHPELQVWRNVGDDIYQKIGGTQLFFPFGALPSKIYEYSKFVPISVQSGDILGIFMPQNSASRLRLLSENTTDQTQYYHSTASSVRSSHFKKIDIQNNEPPLTTAAYHPMVSMVIGRLL